MKRNTVRAREVTTKENVGEGGLDRSSNYMFVDWYKWSRRKGKWWCRKREEELERYPPIKSEGSTAHMEGTGSSWESAAIPSLPQKGRQICWQVGRWVVGDGGSSLRIQRMGEVVLEVWTEKKLVKTIIRMGDRGPGKYHGQRTLKGLFQVTIINLKWDQSAWWNFFTATFSCMRAAME